MNERVTGWACVHMNYVEPLITGTQCRNSFVPYCVSIVPYLGNKCSDYQFATRSLSLSLSHFFLFLPLWLSHLQTPTCVVSRPNSGAEFSLFSFLLHFCFSIVFMIKVFPSCFCSCLFYFQLLSLSLSFPSSVSLSLSLVGTFFF